MPDIISDRRITQEEAGQLMAPLELDLLSAFKVMQEDILTGLENYEGTPEQYIEEVLKNLSGTGEVGEMAVLKGKPLPVGTRRQRSDGVYVKQPDGTWVKETERKPEKEEEKKEEYTRGHLKPYGKGESNVDIGMTVVDEDFLKNGIELTDEEYKITKKAFLKYSGGNYITLTRASMGVGSIEDIEQAKAIERYLEIAPKIKEKLFRGMDVDEGYIKELEKKFMMGDSLQMNGLNSWTTEEKIARDFRKTSKGKLSLMIELENPQNAVSIKHLSVFPNEDEVLYSAKTKFKIKDIEWIDEGLYSLILEEI